jgi:hypothetical protein
VSAAMAPKASARCLPNRVPVLRVPPDPATVEVASTRPSGGRGQSVASGSSPWDSP